MRMGIHFDGPFRHQVLDTNPSVVPGEAHAGPLEGPIAMPGALGIALSLCIRTEPRAARCKNPTHRVVRFNEAG